MVYCFFKQVIHHGLVILSTAGSSEALAVFYLSTLSLLRAGLDQISILLE